MEYPARTAAMQQVTADNGVRNISQGSPRAMNISWYELMEIIPAATHTAIEESAMAAVAANHASICLPSMLAILPAVCTAPHDYRPRCNPSKRCAR